MTKTTKAPTGINGVEYAPKTLAAARLLADDLEGLVAYSPRHGWVLRDICNIDEPWSVIPEWVIARRAILSLGHAGHVGPTPRPRVRSVLNAARQLPEMAAPPAAELGQLTPRR